MESSLPHAILLDIIFGHNAKVINNIQKILLTYRSVRIRYYPWNGYAKDNIAEFKAPPYGWGFLLYLSFM